MLRIRRIEFLVAEIPIIALPLLLTVADPAALGRAPIWEGTLLFFLLFNFGDMINCLADRDLDAVYKPKLSEAVYGLGVRFVAAQIAVTALAALAVAAHLSFLLQRFTILALVAVGLVLGAAYSVKPVQLKGRGLAQLLCLWLIIFVGPMILIASLVRELPSAAVVAVAMTYGALQMGVILVNTAEDYPEDRAAQITTTIVALGLHRGIGLAHALVVVGGAGFVVSLVALFTLRHVPMHGFAALLPLLAALAWVSASIDRLRDDIRGVDVDTSARLVKRAAKRVPIWITAGAWSAFGAALALLLLQPGGT
jgi:lycopene elongase/hydratase (dihydrobisanhydrobacterioruberin-forming)